MKAEMLTEDSHAILLICSSIALPRSPTAPKPLSRLEWNDVARAIGASRFARPGALLRASSEEIERDLGLSSALSRRIVALLERGAQLGMELERMQNLGIWALTRADQQYPGRLKERLKAQAPPVLFGSGNLESLNRPGLAIVGSRDIDEAGAAFAMDLGERCALARLVVLSGGARGVDQIAMRGALEHGGSGVAVLADSLEESLKRREMRAAVLDSRLTLVTALHPSTRFSVAGAMGRNKLIYALASWAAVVSSGVETGGTWAGAIENLRAKWVPLFVRDEEGVPIGNRELIKRGAAPLSLRDLPRDLGMWLDRPLPVARPTDEQPALLRESAAPYGDVTVMSNQDSVGTEDLFRHAWSLLAKYLSQPRTESDVANYFSLERSQAKKWLQRAELEGKLQKLKKRPVRFQIKPSSTDQKSLFEV